MLSIFPNVLWQLIYLCIGFRLVRKTLLQQTPIKPVDGKKSRAINVGLGSEYAKDLGLGGIGDYDPTYEKLIGPSTNAACVKDGAESASGSKKKNNKKKKKK
jgi:hypothetical protein